MAFDGRYFKSFFDNRNKFLDRMSRDSTDIMNAGLNLGDRFLKAKQEAARLRSGEVLAREGEAGATERTRMAQAGETSRLETSIGAQKAMQTEKIGAESEQARLDRENRADMLTAELEARGKLQTQADEAAWERTLMEIDAAFRRSANEGEAAMKRVEAQIAGDKEVAQIRVNADAENKLDPDADILDFLNIESVFRSDYIPVDPTTQQPDLSKIRADEKMKAVVMEDLNKWLNNKKSYTPEMKQAVVDAYQQWLSGIVPIKIDGAVPATAGAKEPPVTIDQVNAKADELLALAKRVGSKEGVDLVNAYNTSGKSLLSNMLGGTLGIQLKGINKEYLDAFNAMIQKLSTTPVSQSSIDAANTSEAARKYGGGR